MPEQASTLPFLLRNELGVDLLPAFESGFPSEAIALYVKEHMPTSREKVHTPANTLRTMLLTALEEDKSMQQSVQKPLWELLSVLRGRRKTIIGR